MTAVRDGGAQGVTRARLVMSAGLLMTLGAFDAHAGGFLVARFGGEHGHPTTENATAIYYNPAALSLGVGTRLFIDGTLAWRSTTYERDPAAIDNPLAEGEVAAGTPVDLIAANSGEATLFSLAAAPFIGVTSDFGVPGLGVGLAVYVPFGGASAWDSKEAVEGAPGALDGPQRWWAIEGTVRTVYVSLGAGYEIPETRLSVGAAFNLTHSTVNTVRARNASGHDHMVAINGSLQEGRALVDASGFEPAMGAGLVYEAIPAALWVGLSYQSQPNFGESVLDGTTRLVQATAPPTTTKVKLFHEYPDIWRLGVRWRPAERHELRLWGDYQRWSVLDAQTVVETEGVRNTLAVIPRYWHDSFGVRGSWSYRMTPPLELMFGAGFDSNAVPDRTLEPGLFDTDKIAFTAGVGYQLAEGITLAATYTQVAWIGRDLAPRGRVIDGTDRPSVDDAEITETDIAPLDLTRKERTPDPAGSYQTTVGALDVTVEFEF